MVSTAPKSLMMENFGLVDVWQDVMSYSMPVLFWKNKTHLKKLSCDDFAFVFLMCYIFHGTLKEDKTCSIRFYF